MRDFEILQAVLQLIDGEKLPTRSYRFSKPLIEKVREVGKDIFPDQDDDTRLLSYFAAYGILKWLEETSTAQQSQKEMKAGWGYPPKSGHGKAEGE